MIPSMVTDLEASIVTVGPGRAQVMSYQDMPADEAEAMGKELRPMSLEPCWSKTTCAARQKIPTTCVLCTKDAPTAVAAAEWLVQIAQASEPNKANTVIRRKVGHSPFLTQPDWTARMLREAATARN